MLICDRRVLSRTYGRMFLASLPTSAIVNVPTRQMLGDLERFFDEEGTDPHG